MDERILDLFCRAGGASVGYCRAGFGYIVGVDIEPQKRYPFEFVQGDALEFLAEHGQDFDVIHASPPCQVYSVTKSLTTKKHPDLVAKTRELLLEVGKPYVIENVPGAPLDNPLMLCGTMFGLRVIRHRLFEIWPETIWFPPFACNHWGKRAPTFRGEQKAAGIKNGDKTFLDKFDFITVAGSCFLKQDAQIAMDIDWMTGAELAQAIPPAYTEYIGKILLERKRATK